MKLIQYHYRGADRWGQYLDTEDVCLDFGEVCGHHDLRSYLQADDVPDLESLQRRALEHQCGITINEVKLRTPINPDTLFGVGRNFNLDCKPPLTPTLFLKSVQTITTHDCPIVIPSRLDQMHPKLRQVCAEPELGLVMGKNRSIFGYTVVNDVTLRGIEAEDIWFYAKSLTSFTPVGPWIVTYEDIPVVTDLDILLEVSGVLTAKGNTRDMLFSPQQIIATISDRLMLMPGDLIMMGCPGLSKDLQHQDVVTVTIDRIGTLQNTIDRE